MRKRGRGRKLDEAETMQDRSAVGGCVDLKVAEALADARAAR